MPAVVPVDDHAAMRMVPVDLVCESAWNPRKHFDEGKLKDLAESIKTHGIITPLIGRPDLRGGDTNDGSADAVELAAGHRRLRAAKLAGVATVPVIVRDMTDNQLLEILTIENLQREDVHPLEEADGFVRLLDQPDYSLATIAEKIGKSESYISKRLALRSLIEPLREAFFAGKINISHAILLARLLPEDQAKLNDAKGHGSLWQQEWQKGKNSVSALSPSRLRDLIESEILLSLSAGRWNKHDPDLVPAAGACSACAKRTGANLALWDDIAKGDRCLDWDCFDRKSQAFLVHIEKKLEASGEKLPRVAIGYKDPKELKELRAVRYVNEYEIHSGKKEPDGRYQKALVVAGPRRGEVIQVREVRGIKLTSDPAAAAKEDAKLRRERFNKKVDHEARKLAWRQAVDKAPKAPTREVMALLVQSFARGCVNSDLLKAYGLGFDGGDRAQVAIDWAAKPTTKLDALMEFLVGMALHDLLGEFCNLEGEYGNKATKAALKALGVDVKQCRAQVEPDLKEKFDASEKRRKEREKPAVKKTAKKAQARSGKMAAAGSKEDEEE